MSTAGSILRKRSAAHKVYVPTKARDNQYLVAQFKITPELLSKHADLINHESEQPYFHLYQHIAQTFFGICDSNGLRNVNFVANGKRTTVRYGEEQRVWQTDSHIQFNYNPKVHGGQRKFFDGKVLVEKVTLLVLATGDELRLNAARFHELVRKTFIDFANKVDFDTTSVRLRDHQHLTYDLFAYDKGCRESITHHFRPIPVRYQSQNIEMPEERNALTYVVATLGLSNKLVNRADIDESLSDAYNPVYTMIADSFISAAKEQSLNNCAVIANNQFPIVRSSQHEEITSNGEFQVIGYNPHNAQGGIACKWDASQLVDEVHFVFLATRKDRTDRGYGKFVNQVEKTLKALSETLGLDTEHEEIVCRVHQHVAYQLG